ncbi:MAG: hypothetical protein H6Q81_1775 [Deltaproteobacteria bacterium]|nr:hypothetical protein [Deltaproteobacteria bacterium]
MQGVPRRREARIAPLASSHRGYPTCAMLEMGRGEGRSCGTGEDLVLFEGMMHLQSMELVRRPGDQRAPCLLDEAGEPRPDATGDAPCGEAYDAAGVRHFGSFR